MSLRKEEILQPPFVGFWSDNFTRKHYRVTQKPSSLLDLQEALGEKEVLWWEEKNSFLSREQVDSGDFVHQFFMESEFRLRVYGRTRFQTVSALIDILSLSDPNSKTPCLSYNGPLTRAQLLAVFQANQQPN